jgi:hypothetical protein
MYTLTKTLSINFLTLAKHTILPPIYLYYLKRLKWFLILPNTFRSFGRPTYPRPTFVAHRSYGPGPKSWLLVRPAWRRPPCRPLSETSKTEEMCVRARVPPCRPPSSVPGLPPDRRPPRPHPAPPHLLLQRLLSRHHHHRMGAASMARIRSSPPPPSSSTKVIWALRPRSYLPPARPLPPPPLSL